MEKSYLLGFLCGILSGVVNACGVILEKIAVNRLTEAQRQSGVMKHVIREPLWWGGIFCSFGLGTFFVLTAQTLIGPALLPGLSASSLIILALASARILNERLRPAEHFAIWAAVLGIALLGVSRLDIPAAQVNLLDPVLLGHIILFSSALGMLWWATWSASRRLEGQRRGLLLAFSSGFPFALSNLWVLPLLLTIGPVFHAAATALQAFLFVLACLILVGTNFYAVSQTQQAFCFASASKVLPIQNIPIQIAPILIYFLVFQRSADAGRGALIFAAVVFILLGGWELSRRKGLLDAGALSAGERHA